jgi:hypothetical protein
MPAGAFSAASRISSATPSVASSPLTERHHEPNGLAGDGLHYWRKGRRPFAAGILRPVFLRIPELRSVPPSPS